MLLILLTAPRDTRRSSGCDDARSLQLASFLSVPRAAAAARTAASARPPRCGTCPVPSSPWQTCLAARKTVRGGAQ